MNCAKTGAFIAELRKKNDMTQKELARGLGVTDKAVSKWERGLAYPSSELIIPLANMFGISASELLSGEAIETFETVENNFLSESIKLFENEIKQSRINAKKSWIIAVIVVMIIILSFTWAHQRKTEVREIGGYLFDVSSSMHAWETGKKVDIMDGQLTLGEYISIKTSVTRLKDTLKNSPVLIDEMKYIEFGTLRKELQYNLMRIDEILDFNVTINQDVVLIDKGKCPEFADLVQNLIELKSDVEKAEDEVYSIYDGNLIMKIYNFTEKTIINLCYPDPMIINGELVF